MILRFNSDKWNIYKSQHFSAPYLSMYCFLPYLIKRIWSSLVNIIMQLVNMYCKCYLFLNGEYLISFENRYSMRIIYNQIEKWFLFFQEFNVQVSLYYFQRHNSKLIAIRETTICIQENYILHIYKVLKAFLANNVSLC